MRDFVGFRFGQIHTDDLHLVVVSSGDRYTKNLLPDMQDYTTDIAGSNGQNYYGSTFSTREFTCDVAFDSVDERTWRRISNLFATDKLQDLVFDELPYKTYRAKLKNPPEFKYICFTDRKTKERVYKGEGTLNFICYQPFAYGFNKYIIRAADHYLLELPKSLPEYNSIYDNPYEKKETRIFNTKTKDFYNVENNMNTPWKGGYPTIEQVQAGELYFDAPDGTKQLIDVRDYFKNVPEWAESSKLLVTPTLDYDQELIYLPQFSKTNYINMDTGLNNENALIGSRLLVYNPGDLPIEFNLDLKRVKEAIGLERSSNFQIRRYNVQRLAIPQAVDWTDLRTLEAADNKRYKYGKKYFKHAEIKKDGSVDYVDLGEKHPKHCYIVEPIPRQQLGHYIRNFYWQSQDKKDIKGNYIITMEEGERIADRYEELYELCIDDCERFELYWQTLRGAIIDKYKNFIDPCNLIICKYEQDIINTYKEELREYYKEFFKQNYTVCLNDEIVWGLIDTKNKLSVDSDGKIVITPYNGDKTPIQIKYEKETDNGTAYYHFYTEELFLESVSNHKGVFLYKTEKEQKIKVDMNNTYIDIGNGKKKIFKYDKLNFVTPLETEIIDPNDDDFYTQFAFVDNNLLKKFLSANKWRIFCDYVRSHKDSLIEFGGFEGSYTIEEIRDYLYSYYDFDKMFYTYIHQPHEFIQQYEGLEYGQDIFNLYRYPQWFTPDYLELSVKEVDDETLKLDTDKRMLYNEYREDFRYSPDGMQNRTYKKKKNILNDYITKGHWFKLPPGWSLIEISPVCNEEDWGGKRWLDARPFYWGYDVNDDNEAIRRYIFDKEVYPSAETAFRERYGLSDNTPISFRDATWDKLKNENVFLYEFMKYRETYREYDFLKIVHDIWRLHKGPQIKDVGKLRGRTHEPDVASTYINGTIGEWWWYACNYTWANFPPLFWGYADILNEARIDYVPLFY